MQRVFFWGALGWGAEGLVVAGNTTQYSNIICNENKIIFRRISKTYVICSQAYTSYMLCFTQNTMWPAHVITCWYIFPQVFNQKLVHIVTAVLQIWSDSLTPASDIGTLSFKIILTIANKCTEIHLLLFQYSFMGLCRFPKPTYNSL
jgi:hypothetical protein